MNIEEEYIKNVEELPSCPDIAFEVLMMAQDVECDFRKLADKINRDPNLTANMLRMANSVIYGYMKKISSVKDMLVRLGLENVKLIAINSASSTLLKPAKEAYGLAYGALWRHSYATAVLASIIGRYAEVGNGATLYTAALLHDVGKVILDRPLQIEILNREPPERAMKFVDFEDYILHTNHAKVGMALLESWGLPDDICIPVGYHHIRDMSVQADVNTKIVYLANLLIENMGLLLTDPEMYDFNVRDQVDPAEIMQDVPNFAGNKEFIIDTFFEKYSDGLSLL
jgi:putative nucleotidyltransferase with HDIG domain